jgi:uncharacterized protein
MLSYDLREIESKAVHVEGDLPADDEVWEEGDTRPEGAVHVTGRLSSAGGSRYFFAGRLSGRLEGECRRCLGPAAADVSEDLQLIYVADEDDETADDPDVYPLDPQTGELDLRPAVREHWLLSAPGFVQCREDCQGLCPQCGANLNEGPCGCPPVTDSRWDALRKAPAEPS